MADEITTKKKILIIEDDEMLGGMYRFKFEQEGYDVQWAKDGIEGLEAIKTGTYALILSDIIMPGLDGFSVLEEFKKSSKFAKTPFILLTNLGTESDQERGSKLGAVAYLVKSTMTPTQVAAEAKKHLEKNNI